MSNSLSILVVTVGRPSLERCLGALIYQLVEGDELVVVADGPACGERARAIWEHVALRLCDGAAKRFMVHPKRLGHHGHPLRTIYQRQLGGDYVMHYDDDNFYMPGALQKVRKHLRESNERKRMYLFRMVTNGQLAEPVVWRTKEVKQGNVDTGCGVLPNLGAAFPPWPSEYGGDGLFYEAMEQLVTDAVFVDGVLFVYCV